MPSFNLKNVAIHLQQQTSPILDEMNSALNGVKATVDRTLEQYKEMHQHLENNTLRCIGQDTKSANSFEKLGVIQQAQAEMQKLGEESGPQPVVPSKITGGGR